MVLTRSKRKAAGENLTSLPDEFFKPKRTKKRTPQKPKNRPHAVKTKSKRIVNPDGKIKRNLKICAFNIQIFGDAKMADDFARTNLVKIFKNFDLVAVQEIRDSNGDAFPAFVEALNAERNVFDMAVGERQGRSHSKEQYGFVWNRNRIELKESFNYKDSGDKFEREPFVGLFSTKVKSQCLKDFFVIPIHTKPGGGTVTEDEINELVNVYDHSTKKFNTTSCIIAGDFNAEGSYVSKKNLESLKLRTDKRFTWHIGNEVDTTVGNSDCAYDRILTTGDCTTHAIDAQVYKFDDVLDLSQEEALKISDH